MDDVEFLKAHPSRTCGDCQLCCKVMAVRSISKPEGKWCTHCSVGPNGGCSLYPSHPQDCKDFVCSWLAGLLPVTLKPSACKVVVSSATLTIGDDKIDCLNVYVDADRPDAYKTGLMGDYLRYFGRRLPAVPIVIICGQHRSIIANDPILRLRLLSVTSWKVEER